MKSVVSPSVYQQFQLGVVACALMAGSFSWAQSTSTEPRLTYTVKPSDTLIAFTRDMLVSPKVWPEVAAFNQLKNPNKIAIGQQLHIPVRLLKPQSASTQVVAVQGDVSSAGTSLRVGSALPEGASIQTAANSSAVLQLADGSRVKMLPNTLAQVTQNRHYAMRDASQSGSTTWYSGVMRLVQGGLDVFATKNVRRASPLQVQTPTSLIGVRGTEFRVGYEDPASRSARTEVLEGKVRADNPAQASGADLPGGFGAIIHPQQKEVKAVKLLDAPDLTHSPSFAQQASGMSAWPFAPVPGATSYRVQVAQDAEFDQLVQDIKTGNNQVNLGLLKPGAWFVRVRAVDPQGLEGFNAAKAIRVTADQLLLPTFSLRNGKSIFHIQTAQGSRLTNMRAVIAKDPQFAQVMAQTALTQTDWQVEGLKGGTYYLKIESTETANLATEKYRLELPENWGDTVFDSVGGLYPF